ncbi:recombinase RecT [Candidatus Sororendozoicomonas aggregata]|uniref:recombinase RecT n=1 Tax=Candidatus Sororendozoicomonas aggregata TaxID=3073239 RepID=UPI002ED1F461
MLPILQKNQLAIDKALDGVMHVNKFLRIIATELRKNPRIQSCEPATVLGSVIQAATLGLQVGGVLGHCYLVPFFNKHTGRQECQFMLGYRGMIKLARESGEIASIEARVVYDNEKFSVQYGTQSYITHSPAIDGSAGKILGVYGIAKMTSGEDYIEWLHVSKIEGFRTRSKSGNAGPWQTDYEEMAKKTVVRRMFKFLPLGEVAQKAAKQDELEDLNVVEGEASEVVDIKTGEVLEAQPTHIITNADDLNNAL